RVLLKRRDGTGAYIARRAHLERDVVGTQVLKQLTVLDRPNAVPDTLRSDPDGLPDTFRTGHFPGVTSQVQTRVFGLPVEISKPRSRPPLLISADPDRNDSAVSKLPSDLEHANGRF